MLLLLLPWIRSTCIYVYYPPSHPACLAMTKNSTVPQRPPPRFPVKKVISLLESGRYTEGRLHRVCFELCKSASCLHALLLNMGMYIPCPYLFKCSEYNMLAKEHTSAWKLKDTIEKVVASSERWSMAKHDPKLNIAESSSP